MERNLEIWVGFVGLYKKMGFGLHANMDMTWRKSRRIYGKKEREAKV